MKELGRNVQRYILGDRQRFIVLRIKNNMQQAIQSKNKTYSRVSLVAFFLKTSTCFLTLMFMSFLVFATIPVNIQHFTILKRLYDNIKCLSQFEQFTFVRVVTRNVYLYGLCLTTNTKRRCTWSVSQHRCSITVGGLYNPHPLPVNWFGMALDGPPCECANGVKVGR